MKLLQIFTESEIIGEANISAKIKDPKMIKQVAIAIRHDGTIPKHKIAALGPKPTDEDVLKLWSELLDSSLRNTNYGDLSQDGKFDEWLTRLYVNGQVDYEEVNGEGGDALGAWKALSIRQRLKPEHQDFNKFRNIRQIQDIVRKSDYRDELRRIKNAEVIEKHKREKKELTILNTKRFMAVVPFNYGACYTFNNSAGFQASFCTGSSSGLEWFDRYAKEGPIVSIIDKNNFEEVDGKWQMHAPTSQLNNGDQRNNGDRRFAELFPGLMKKVIAGLEQHAAEINNNSTEIVHGGYDMARAIDDIKKRFPISVASESPEGEDDEEDSGPGIYIVKHKESGRAANIPAESAEDALAKVLARFDNMTADDFEITKKKESAEEEQQTSP
jgi:hypothetical protein